MFLPIKPKAYQLSQSALRELRVSEIAAHAPIVCSHKVDQPLGLISRRSTSKLKTTMSKPSQNQLAKEQLLLNNLGYFNISTWDKWLYTTNKPENRNNIKRIRSVVNP